MQHLCGTNSCLFTDKAHIVFLSLVYVTKNNFQLKINLKKLHSSPSNCYFIKLCRDSFHITHATQSQIVWITWPCDQLGCQICVTSGTKKKKSKSCSETVVFTLCHSSLILLEFFHDWWEVYHSELNILFVLIQNEHSTHGTHRDDNCHLLDRSTDTACDSPAAGFVWI